MDAFDIDESFFEELFRNDDDWVAKAIALEDLLAKAAVVASKDAATAEAYKRAVSAVSLERTIIHSTFEANKNEQGIIVCPNIESIPPGKQSSKVLRCGVPGCPSTKLFDRKYELQRHMETHEQGKFPCLVNGCDRGQLKPFKRKEHLRNHLEKIHG